MDNLLETTISVQVNKRETKIHSFVLSASDAAAFRFDMWELYQKYYKIDRSSFFDRFHKNDCYAIYWSGNTMIGFTAIRMRHMEVGKRTYLSFYLGQSVIEKTYRGQSLITQTCARLFMKHYLRHPLVPIYVWCDALTYKPYLIFANAFQHYYPSPKGTTPKEVAQLIQKIGQDYYKDSFDETTGTVRKATSVVDDVTTWITEEDLQHPAIQFFVDKNPKHLSGDGLLTIAPVSLINLLSLLKHLWLKKLGK